MLRSLEATSPGSCWLKARDDEIVFVMLARDAAAPDAIRAWAYKRVQLGYNKEDDPQILEALGTADLMDAQRPALRASLGLVLSEADEVQRDLLQEGGP